MNFVEKKRQDEREIVSLSFSLARRAAQVGGPGRLEHAEESNRICIE